MGSLIWSRDRICLHILLHRNFCLWSKICNKIMSLDQMRDPYIENPFWLILIFDSMKNVATLNHLVQGWQKVRYCLSTFSNQELFGNSFFEFKLWLISEVTLHIKVAFGKNESFRLTYDLWRMPITITKKDRKDKKCLSLFHA